MILEIHLQMIVLIFVLSTQKMYREKMLLNPLPLLRTLEHNNLEHIMIKDFKSARNAVTEIIHRNNLSLFSTKA